MEIPGQVAFFDSISDLHFASANAVDLDLNGRDEVILIGKLSHRNTF